MMTEASPPLPRSWFTITPQSYPCRFWGIALLTVLACAFLIATELTQTAAAKPNSAQLANVKDEQLKDTYDRRMKLYLEHSQSLLTNFRLQCIVLVLAVVMIVAPLEAVSLKGVGLDVPAWLIQLAVPVVLLYLWLGMGYLLNTLVDDRLILGELISKIESPSLSSSEYFSARRLLRDDFFMDEYFLAFHPNTTGIPEHAFRVFNRIILICFGLFLGAGHGCMVATICNNYEERYSSKRCHKRFITYIALILLFLAASHFQFYFSGNPNWLQHVILFSSPVWVWLLAGRLGIQSSKPAVTVSRSNK